MTRKSAYANGKHDLRRGIDFIGVTCGFLCHDGKGNFVMNKRSKNCRDEQGCWDIGAGAHEFGETIEDTVRREVKEEYGATVKKVRHLKTYDLLRQLPDGTSTHWLGVVFAALIDPKQVTNNEPYKIDELQWFRYDNLPTPLHSQMSHELATAHEAGII